MALRYVPSGATPSYLKARVWLNPDGSLHSVDRLVEQFLDPDHEKRLLDQGLTPRWLGPYSHPDTMLRRYSPWWMTNPVDLQLLDPMRDGSFRKIVNFAEAGDVQLWSDSGGWAIKSGVRDWLDPRLVIEALNKYAHRGMALDIPPRVDWDTTPFFLQVLAQAQRHNNLIMAAGKRPDLELVNVLHGIFLDDLKFWGDTVNNPGFMGWATALDTLLPDPIVGVKGVSLIRGAALLYDQFRHREGVMHLFGKSGQGMIAVAGWMGRSFPELTLDSTSWIPKRHNYALNLEGRLTSMPYGEKFKGEEEDRLPCTCEFCGLMGTFGKMREEGGSAVRPLVAAHNIVTILKVVEYWNTLAQTLDFAAYRREVKAKVAKSKEALRLLDYAALALQEGPAKADKEFSIGRKAFPVAC